MSHTEREKEQLFRSVVENDHARRCGNIVHFKTGRVNNHSHTAHGLIPVPVTWYRVSMVVQGVLDYQGTELGKLTRFTLWFC